MNKQQIKKFIGKDTLSISEVMQRINNNAHGILFLTNTHGTLRGCITDGDIRRYLLSEGKVDGLAIGAANLYPVFSKDLKEAKQLYNSKHFTAIPIVNEKEKIIDIYCGEEGQLYRKHDSLDIPVVINAGGRGTRLDPFTKVLPKPLIPVGDYPIIELIMQEFITYNCCDFHVIVNYKRDLIKAYFHESDSNYCINWYDELTPLGTGGGLSLLKGVFNDTFFFSNCDILLTADYGSMVRFHKANKNSITMICAYKNINVPYGVVEMGANGILKSMKEKPLFSFLVNTGMYIVEPEIVDGLIADEIIGFPEIMKRAKRKGKKVAVFPIGESDWMDMGQMSELERMRERLYGE